MKLVADASVAIKWYVEQPHTKEAMQLAASDVSLVAPELLLVEAGNAFWKYVRTGIVAAQAAQAALSELPRRFESLAALAPLANSSLEIAVSLKHPIYDCFYLALARRENAPLITADKRLAAAAKSLPSVEVRLLGSQ
jgi:predicted nucleic acid-binding protein